MGSVGRISRVMPEDRLTIGFSAPEKAAKNMTLQDTAEDRSSEMELKIVLLKRFLQVSIRMWRKTEQKHDQSQNHQNQVIKRFGLSKRHF